MDSKESYSVLGFEYKPGSLSLTDAGEKALEYFRSILPRYTTYTTEEQYQECLDRAIKYQERLIKERDG
jgi:hypothetical protein